MKMEDVQVFKEFLNLVKEVKEVYDMTGHEAHNYVKYTLGSNGKKEDGCECSSININFSYEDIKELDKDELIREISKHIKRQQGLK